MATLAVGIETKLAALVAAPTIIDMSRQRSASGTEDTAKTTAAAEMAAAEVESYLGDSLTDSDTVAVALGTRLALLQFSQVWSLKLTDAGTKAIRDVRADLERVQRSRVAEASDPVVTDFDYAWLDARYPARTWDDEGDAEPVDP